MLHVLHEQGNIILLLFPTTTGHTPKQFAQFAENVEALNSLKLIRDNEAAVIIKISYVKRKKLSFDG